MPLIAAAKPSSSAASALKPLLFGLISGAGAVMAADGHRFRHRGETEIGVLARKLGAALGAVDREAVGIGGR